MLNISARKKTTFRERSNTIKSLDAEIKSCMSCGLCKTRTNVVTGRYLEPSDAIIVDWMPNSAEDKAGAMLEGGRSASFDKLFSLSKPTLDITKLSFTSVYKCFGEDTSSSECLKFLDQQLREFDPVLIIALGEDVLSKISGRKDLKAGVAYVCGEENQFLLYQLIHPRAVVADKDKNVPVWKVQLQNLAALAARFDLKIFK